MAELRFASILGTGHYAPEKILSNADLEKMVDTSDEWIRTRTGIATRHIASASETTSDLCVKAAEKALEAAGKTIDDIDFILVATASPDYVVPSTACMVQDKMGAKHAGAMDISAGCSGYIYAVACASNMVKAGMYDNVLVIGAEILSRLVDWQDRSTCILFGDGAGAAVIGQVDEGYGLLASELGSDGSLGKILKIPASDVAIIRVEQLYPFPHKAFAAEIKRYPNATDLVWCQDEPQNQGAWFFVQHYIHENMAAGQKLGYAGRAASASPAVGYAHLHQDQQKALIDAAIGRLKGFVLQK